ncbi:MAG: murein transglycosylase A [Alphaproteobacteria bacterium]|nr:murein transglycosylase A [Alphaproteobacteria bacterium]
MYLKKLLILSLSIFLANCQKKTELLNFKLSKHDFNKLSSWQDDAQDLALIAFKQSCGIWSKQNTSKQIGPKFAGFVKDWLPICKEADNLNAPSSIVARQFFMQHFNVYKVESNSKGLFTGYYEPLLEGAPEKTATYSYPLYKHPDDLIMIENLGIFNPKLKGMRISGKIKDKKLVPYASRKELDQKELPPENVLCWVKDEVDAFFLHIQGSGRIQFEDGKVMKLGYAAQNGHSYQAIAKFLVQDGHITKEEASLQSIKAYLAKNPDKIKHYLWKNPSYVFFRQLESENAIGAMGCPLTPERSLAIDRAFLPLGIPIWLETTPSARFEKPIQRLVIAQDTGGAIKGPIRGDLFWGASKIAEEKAGIMKEEGNYYVLLPKHLKILD